MSIKDSLEYRNFFIRKLSVDLTTEIKEYNLKDTNVTLNFGIAQPSIVLEKDKQIAVFPFRVELTTTELTLISEFLMGFEIKNHEIDNKEKLKALVNEKNGDFVKFVNKAVNQIIDNALEHSNVKLEEVVVIDPFQYKL